MRRSILSLSSSLLCRSSALPSRCLPSLSRFSSRASLSLLSSSSLSISPLCKSQLLPQNDRFLSAWTVGSRMYSDEATPEEPEMDEREFTSIVDEVLEELTIVFEEIADHLSSDEMDVTNASGVITFNTGEKGTFVINKQTPNRQVWLSSPLSGPKRYRYDPETQRWVNTRDGHLLTELLRTELNSLLDLSLPPMPFWFFFLFFPLVFPFSNPKKKNRSQQN